MTSRLSPAVGTQAGVTGRTTPSRSRRARGIAFGAAVGLLVATVAPAAIAADPLRLTTPYPAISVSPGATASFTISVSTAAEQRVALSVSGAPAGWTATLRGGGFAIDAVQTAAGTPAEVRLDIKIPETAAAGTTRLSVIASAGSLRATLPLDVRVSVDAGGDLSLVTDFANLRGPSSTRFTFNLTLNNDTAEDLTYAATPTGPAGWDVQATLTGQAQAASAIVKAGATSAISVTVQPPQTVDAGTYPIRVDVAAGSRSASADLNVEITGTNAVTLTTLDQRLSTRGSAGETIEQQLVIQNAGTAPLEGLTVTATTPSDWTVEFDPAPTIDTIAAGAEAIVTAKIVPSNDAIAGDYVVSFRAANDVANASREIRVTVETSPLFGAVGIALIVAVFGGLWYVFQRYGRR